MYIRSTCILQDIDQSRVEYTGGKGVDVVYDGTGKTTFEKSLAVVKEGGRAVLYGWPSGMPDIDKDLMKQRKIKFAFDALNDYPAIPGQKRKGYAQ